MNVRQFNALGLVAFGALSAATASAQVRCTMPNGRVIEQQLANVCPQGTVKAETLDGRPARIVTTPPPPPAPPAPAPQVTRPQVARQSVNTANPGQSAGGGESAVISAKCAMEWPDDFRMRAYCEKKQDEGLSTVRRPVDAPPREAEIIRRKCAGEWPTDFRMRAYCERKQVEGLRQLQR
ncbi:MAG: hypothetical protein Q8S02_08655 [Hydrogenophaga sp.]|nr:hypothetical protein [Hydrogenophaga sp.]